VVPGNLFEDVPASAMVYRRGSRAITDAIGQRDQLRAFAASMRWADELAALVVETLRERQTGGYDNSTTSTRWPSGSARIPIA
jgi:hypothetical protein